jgi:hypothetical protein
MAYSVEYDSSEDIIVANITGKTNLSDFREVLLIIIQLVKQRKCFRILTDLREAKVNASVMEMYTLPGDISEAIKEQDLNIHVIKRAFVAPKDKGHLDFYETVSRNQSHSVRLFYDFDEAKAWVQKA